MGQQLQIRKEPITVNAICPGMVPSGLVPPAAINAMEADMVTVPQTIVNAIDRFLADDTLNGHVLECSGTDLVSRPPCSPENKAAEYMLGGSYVPDYDFEKLAQHNDNKKTIYDRIEAETK